MDRVDRVEDTYELQLRLNEQGDWASGARERVRRI